MHLEDLISTGRLSIYETILKLKKEDVLGAYNWNKSLSSSIQPLIHCIEVTLRNSIDYNIRHTPPPGAYGLYRTDNNWIFDLFRYLGDKKFPAHKRYTLDANGQIEYLSNKIPKYNKTIWEEEAIRKVSKRIKDAGKEVTAERIISGLELGFWTNLMTAAYEDPRTKSLLWPNLLSAVFPGAPIEMRKRYILEQRLNQIKALRNRISHHEAIWKFQYTDNTGKPDYQRPVYGLKTSLDLLTKNYKDMLELLQWISPNRYQIFINHGHHHSFFNLCSETGLKNYLKPQAPPPTEL